MISPQDRKLVELLLSRLERISADAYWAHRASGVRGSLLRWLERMEVGQAVDETRMKQTIDAGFHILEKAAKERVPSRLGITPKQPD